jgi:hypothetical protein
MVMHGGVIHRAAGFGCRARGYEHLADLMANDASFPLQLGGGWRLDPILVWDDHHALAGLRAFATASVVADAAAVAPHPEESAKRKPGRVE